MFDLLPPPSFPVPKSRLVIGVLAVVLAAFLAACAGDDPNVKIVAERLADEGGGTGLPQEYRAGYVECGVEALSEIDSERLAAATNAPDVFAIWEILGSDALDQYVKVCRQLDLQRGPPVTRSAP